MYMTHNIASDIGDPTKIITSLLGDLTLSYIAYIYDKSLQTCLRFYKGL